MRFPCLLAMLLAALLAPGASVPRAQASAPPTGAPDGGLPDGFRRARVPAMLLKPLPKTGGIPRMAPKHRRAGTPEQWARFDATFSAVRSRSFGANATTKARAAGIATIRESTDPASFESLYGAFRGQKDEVALAMLDTFAKGGEEGQYALACVAIQDEDRAVRAEATRRIALPPSEAVLSALDDGLRSDNHDWVDRAGLLSGAVHAVEALPTLIFAQFSQGSAPAERGDRAWIAIGHTVSYVANVVPVVGNNSGAYQPVIGQIIEGVVMRVQDCVATIYHGSVHDSLVAMSTYDFGSDTSGNGWDIRAWAKWFDERYVPFKRAQDEELAKAAAAAP
jgi:hypothetical protein